MSNMSITLYCLCFGVFLKVSLNINLPINHPQNVTKKTNNRVTWSISNYTLSNGGTVCLQQPSALTLYAYSIQVY